MQGHLGLQGPTLGQPCPQAHSEVPGVASWVACVSLIWDKETVAPVFQLSPFYKMSQLAQRKHSSPTYLLLQLQASPEELAIRMQTSDPQGHTAASALRSPIQPHSVASPVCRTLSRALETLRGHR